MRFLPILFSVLMLFVGNQCIAQESKLDIGIEFQAYPTGLIPGVRIEKAFKERHAAHVRIGVNLFDHQDFGKNLTEEGSGLGFSVGYKRYFNSDFKGLSLGIRNDFWWNGVDWTDVTPTDAPISGQTNITVVQPTLEAAYLMELGHIYLAPSVAFGMEFNVVTDGRPTGEGPILLVGIGAGLRF